MILLRGRKGGVRVPEGMSSGRREGGEEEASLKKGMGVVKVMFCKW